MAAINDLRRAMNKKMGKAWRVPEVVVHKRRAAMAEQLELIEYQLRQRYMRGIK